MSTLLDDHLRKLFQYDPETGIITRKIDWYGLPAGTPIGRTKKDGYVFVRIGFNGKERDIFGHRLGWFLHHGEWPPCALDHRNGVRHDNRLGNLRNGGEGVNQHNAAPRRDKASGLPGGVFLNESKVRPYRVTIKLEGVRYNIGSWPTEKMATRVYEAIKRELHPEWANGQGALKILAAEPSEPA